MIPSILVVNDVQAILNLYYDVLDSDDYELELSKYEFETLESIEKLHPNLIILDFDVNDRAKGWQLLEMLKMARTTASIPLLLCTPSLNDVREQENYLQEQGIVIVYKPSNPDQLIHMVRQMLSLPIYGISS